MALQDVHESVQESVSINVLGPCLASLDTAGLIERPTGIGVASYGITDLGRTVLDVPKR